MKIFVTGTAGFIGFHLAKRLLDGGHSVVGVDSFTPYYDLALKESRNALLASRNGFQGHRIALEDRTALERLWRDQPCDIVIHLAAQAGVRYSLENPRAYIDSNLVGTFNIMELTRINPVKHFMLASTSSVYGANAKMPFCETDGADHQLTLYAATKKATENMAHCYAHLWDIPTTAFRFFTVYGPWGRPDMAPAKFMKGILAGTPIDVYNHGNMSRDFTYIDDLVEAITRLMHVPPSRPPAGTLPDAGDSLSPVAPHRVVNIGGGAPSGLIEFIEELEKATGKKAVRNYMPMQPGDVPSTFANADLLEKLTAYRPATSVAEGVKAFTAWYIDYYG